MYKSEGKIRKKENKNKNKKQQKHTKKTKTPQHNIKPPHNTHQLNTNTKHTHISPQLAKNTIPTPLNIIDRRRQVITRYN